jgi:hypothetical protein
MLQPIGTCLCSSVRQTNDLSYRGPDIYLPAIKISDVDQPRNLAKSVTVEWKIPFRRVSRELTNIVDILRQ